MEKSPLSRLMTRRLMVSYQPQPLMVSCQKVLSKFQHTLSNSMDHHIILPSLLMDRRHHPSMENLQDTLSLLVMEQCQAILSRQWTLAILSQVVTEHLWNLAIHSKLVMELHLASLHLGMDSLPRIQLIHILMG